MKTATQKLNEVLVVDCSNCGIRTSKKNCPVCGRFVK